MIEEVIFCTKQNDSAESIIDFSKLEQIDFKKIDYKNFIEKRESNRDFEDKKVQNPHEVHQLFEFINDIKNEILVNPDILSLCFLDSQCCLNIKRGIYVYRNREFISLNIREEIENNSLFLQEELNKGTGVLLFLWRNDILTEIARNKPYQYREILTISGILGYLASVFGFSVDYKGTVFAGAIQKEWDRILVNSEYKPIFAYAFEQ